MAACIIAFISMFTFVFSLVLLGYIPGSMFTTLLDGAAPLPMMIMLIGLIGMIITLLWIRNVLGGSACEVDRYTFTEAYSFSLRAGLFASVISALLQTYLRITHGASDLFFIKAESIAAVIGTAGALETPEGVILAVSLAVLLFVGLPWFILGYFNGDFAEYVTVTMTEYCGETIETDRSESYLPVWRFVLLGLLLAAPILLLSVTPLIYFYPVPFAAILFGGGDEKRMKSVAIATAVIGAIIGGASMCVGMLLPA